MIEVISKTILAGDIYGRLTVLGTFKEEGSSHTLVRVQCSCGSDIRYVRADALRKGTSKSCGCLQRETVTKHGKWNPNQRKRSRNYRNVIIEHNGKRMCVADWSMKLNVPASLLYDRLSQGWYVQDVLNTPSQSPSSLYL